MQYGKTIRYAILLTFAILVPSVVLSVPQVHAAPLYFLTPVPGVSQEGSTITLVLTVIQAVPSTSYQFGFIVKDPSGKNWTSTLRSHNTTATETSFSMLVFYPDTMFAGKNSLVGQYNAQVNQVKPVPITNAASTAFYILLTDNTDYQRTQTVKIQASGYNATESTTVTIRTQTNPVVVFSRTIIANSLGIVTTQWKIPRNATIDNYIVTVTGSSTAKSPPDVQGFQVHIAQMTIANWSSSQSSYERTQTMKFTFTATYPDATTATTGAALVTLRSSTNQNVTLTATYDNVAHVFSATYKTSITNDTGVWNAYLMANAYADNWGNTGPGSMLTSSPQLDVATMNVAIQVNSYFATGQTINFNATITYPDGTLVQPGGTVPASVLAFLSYTANPGAYNYSIPVVYDSGFGHWVGSYSPLVTDPGGLWTLKVIGSDAATPSNSGSATRAITLQDRPPIASFSANPTSTITGTLVTLNATSSYDPDGSIVTYNWNFGDGTTGNGMVTTHTYNTASGPTGYTVTLIVTDNSGSTATAYSQVNVGDRPPVVSFTLSTNSTSVGQNVALSITSSDPDGTISTTKVDWGDGTIDTLSGSVTSDSHTYSSAGSTGTTTYSITVTVIDNSGSTTPATHTIRVQAASNGTNSNGNVAFPLYYFGILAAVIAALLVGLFLAFRRHKVTHTKLKIDLEAVKSEAGRIENQEFFQSVKDQLKKDKESGA